MRIWKMTLGLAFVAAVAAWFAPKLLSTPVPVAPKVTTIDVTPVQTIPEVRETPPAAIPEVPAKPDPTLEDEWMLMVDCGMG